MSNEQNENKKERRPFAPGLCFSKLVWVFLISCVVGFLVETLWCYIRHGYIESRQSLVYGPLSVAYGMGAVVLTMALYKFRNSPWCILWWARLRNISVLWGKSWCLGPLPGITAMYRWISMVECAYCTPSFGVYWELRGSSWSTHLWLSWLVNYL